MMRDITQSLGDPALKNNEVKQIATKKKQKKKAVTFDSSLRGIPVHIKTRFQELKDSGVLRGSLNTHMINAVEEYINKYNDL